MSRTRSGLIVVLLFVCLLGANVKAVAAAEESAFKLDELRAPEWEGERHVNSIGIVLRSIPSQTFRMGSQGALEQPIHDVELSGFWLGAFEVTNQQYEQFDPAHKRERPSRLDDSPVTGITWCNAVGFCYWLSKREHVEYRLPTEAEWECAARGGLVGKSFPWGDDDPKGRANLFPAGVAKPVGSYAPNGYGLFDMVGNANEFCWDVLDRSNYYKTAPRKDPRGPGRELTEEFRVFRGGSFSVAMGGDMNAVRSPVCAFKFPDVDNGFRVAVGTAPWQLYQHAPRAKCDNAKRLLYPCYHP